MTIMQAFDLVPIDVVSFGNHEFDISPDKLNSSLESNYGTTFLSTNIDNIAGVKKYYIYRDSKTNFTIGFIGLCTQDFYQKFPVKFLNDEQINHTINNVITKYKPDIMIGLTHADLEEDIRYAEKFPQIDLILGGHVHSHDYHDGYRIPIVRTGENADSIYEINIYTNKTFSIDLVDISNEEPDLDIIKLYQEKEKYFENYNTELLFYFESIYSNSSPRTNPESICQLICSLVTKYFSSELTILNSGMFKLRGRDFIGKFTVGNFKELMPFNDYIVVIQISPDDLIKGIEYSNEKYYNDGGYLQTDKVELITYFNTSLTKDKNITISISTLVLDGIDSNPYFEKYKVKNKYDGVPVHNIVMSYKGNSY
jgi:5'-nucleotidase